MTTTLSGLRLLLVEDETLVAMMVEDMLADLGCVVVDVAGTLSRGLALVADQGLDLDGAILDVNLGGEKVYPVAEALAARCVPFIFATGYGNSGLPAAWRDRPTLQKPFTQEQVSAVLGRALHESGAGR